MNEAEIRESHRIKDMEESLGQLIKKAKLEMDIDISKYDKAEVLIALYNHAKPQSMGFLHYNPRPMSKTEAAALLDKQTYFDYEQGRVMKVDLSGDTFSPRLYDRDNGAGAAQSAINTI